MRNSWGRLVIWKFFIFLLAIAPYLCISVLNNLWLEGLLCNYKYFLWGFLDTFIIGGWLIVLLLFLMWVVSRTFFELVVAKSWSLQWFPLGKQDFLREDLAYLIVSKGGNDSILRVQHIWSSRGESKLWSVLDIGWFIKSPRRNPKSRVETHSFKHQV